MFFFNFEVENEFFFMFWKKYNEVSRKIVDKNFFEKNSKQISNKLKISKTVKKSKWNDFHM